MLIPLKEKWASISAKHKKWILWAGVTTLAVLFLLFVIPDSAGPRNRAPQEKVIASVLTDGDTNGVSQNAIAARIRALDKTIKDQGQLIKELTEKYGSDQTAQRLSNLENNQKKSGAEVAAIKKRVDTVSNPVPYSQQSRGATPLAGNGQRNVPTLYKPEEISAPSVAPRNSGSFNNGKTLQRVYEDAAPPVVPEPAANQRQQKGKDGKAVPSQVTPEIITVQEDIEAAPVADEDDNPENQTYLPATSIISTVLIAGMDAPTSRDARKDPYPALARVKKDAILPNRFRADIRECGMLAAGFGDLSSERAYFRSEVITCIRDDGAVFEAPLVAYAVGEDGKSGVRGRLVTKQGQYLARALTAGFLQAASQLFNVQSIPTISIKRDGDSSDATPYQQVMSSDALQGAAVSGVGGALNRLADFYMQMAGDLFPVIEIDPGRSVDFIVQKGVMLKFTRVTSKTQTVGGKK
ncbi:conjugal transfer protein TrbI [Salmonella enterica]|nr:conjugal transfer protein TrbI [Salmonella enterica]